MKTVMQFLTVVIMVGGLAADAQAAATATGDVSPNLNPLTWTSTTDARIGYAGIGSLDIDAGSDVLSAVSHIGRESGSTGAVTVAGDGSSWTNTWRLYVGLEGSGSLDITSGGLVSVAGILYIDYIGGDESFINMSTGGMLALNDSSWTTGDGLAEFLGLIGGSSAINYLDGTAWANITGATYGDDYILTHITDGDLVDYTVLTVPEPMTLALLGLGGLMLRRRKA